MATKREDDFFWAAVDRGELVVRKCQACEQLCHPPTALCPACGARDWGEQRLSGRGTIYSWIVVRHPSLPDDPDARVAVILDLEEGVRFASNLIDADNAAVGAPVALEFGEIKGAKLPLFRTVVS